MKKEFRYAGEQITITEPEEIRTIVLEEIQSREIKEIKVKFYKNIEKEEKRKMRKCVIQVKGEDLQKGTFHGWSDKLFEVGDKVKSQRVAIVELESGIVREIYPTDITFV